MNGDFWSALDRLVSESRIVIDRPKGSHHPRFQEMVYPLDYGYLEGTTAGDGGGIDLFLGSKNHRTLSAIILTVDLHKHDAEIKLVLGCTEEDTQIALDHLNRYEISALLVHRPQNSQNPPQEET